MLLLLLACFAPNARSYETFLVELNALDTDPSGDTDAATDTDTGLVPDTDETPFEQCSEPVGEARVVSFVNGSTIPADLYYINPDCSRQIIALLAPGQSTDRFSSEGDVWRLWDAFGGTGFIAAVRDDGVGSERVLVP